MKDHPWHFFWNLTIDSCMQMNPSPQTTSHLSRQAPVQRVQIKIKPVCPSVPWCCLVWQISVSPYCSAANLSQSDSHLISCGTLRLRSAHNATDKWLQWESVKKRNKEWQKKERRKKTDEEQHFDNRFFGHHLQHTHTVEQYHHCNFAQREPHTHLWLCSVPPTYILLSQRTPLCSVPPNLFTAVSKDTTTFSLLPSWSTGAAAPGSRVCKHRDTQSHQYTKLAIHWLSKHTVTTVHKAGHPLTQQTETSVHEAGHPLTQQTPRHIVTLVHEAGYSLILKIPKHTVMLVHEAGPWSFTFITGQKKKKNPKVKKKRKDLKRERERERERRKRKKT